MRKMLLAAGLLLGFDFVGGVLAQDSAGVWVRATVNGEPQCVNAAFDQPFNPSYDSPSYTTVSCNVSNQFTAWLANLWGVSVAEAQTIILVNSGQPCVPTPSGVVDTRYCDGDDGTAGSGTFEWATIPNFTNKIEGTAFSVNLRTSYLTEYAVSTITIEGCTLSGGWSFSSPTLAYSDTGTATITGCFARAVLDTVTLDSNTFSVQSVAAAMAPGTDTTAPTSIVGVSVTLDGNDDPVISFDPPTDVSVSGEDTSELATFTVLRNGTPLTPTAFTGDQIVPIYSADEVGTVNPSIDAVQTGADWTVGCGGGHPNTATDFCFLNTEIIAGNFICTAKVASSTGGTHTARGFGLAARDTLDAGSRHFGAHTFVATLNTRAYVRDVTDGAVVQSGLVTTTGLPYRKLTRVGNVLTEYGSDSPNGLGIVHSQTIGLNPTLSVGGTVTSNENTVELEAVFENFSCNTLPRQSFTDTGATAGTTPSYTIVATDTEGNVSAASTAVSIAVPDVAPPPGPSDTADYAFDVTGTTLLTRTETPVANSAALTTALTDQDCGETLLLATGAYNGNWTTTVQCPTNNPFLIMCATPLGCTGTGIWALTGSSNILSGIDCNATGCRANVYGQDNKLIGNRFRNRTTGTAVHISDAVLTGLTRAEVAYNDIGPYAGTATNQHIAVHGQTSTNVNTAHSNFWFHHNYVHGGKNGTGNDTDFMEVNNSGNRTWIYTFQSGLYIEDNLFTDHLDCGQPFIDLKYSDGVIRRNTFAQPANCVMNIQPRKGNDTIFESNWLSAGGRIVLQGAGHTAVCNAGGTIRVQAGESAANSIDNLHQASLNVLVAGNGTAQNPTALVVGYAPNANYDVPADEIVVEDHIGTITTALVDDWTDNRNSASSYNCPPAVQLTTADVGHDALASATAGYLLARGLSDAADPPDPPTETAFCDPLDWTTGCPPDAVTDGGTISASRSAVNCTDAACIHSNLVAGRTITLTASITAAVNLSGTGTRAAPIIIDGNGQTVSNLWTLTGAYQYVTGATFTRPATQVTAGGTYNKLLGNVFTDFRRCIAPVKPGEFLEIAYNEFHTPDAYAGTGYQDRICIRTTEDGSDGVQQDVWIHHNYFHDFPDKPDPDVYSSGQNDVIELCESNNASYLSSFSPRWWITDNLVVNHAQGTNVGAGTIDLKCPGGVVVRNLTFTNVEGRLDIRGRSTAGASLEANYIPGSNMAIHSCNNRILGNNFNQVDLLQGDIACDGAGAASTHAVADNTLLEGNTGTIRVGPTPTRTNKPDGTIIRDQTGTVTLTTGTNTTNTPMAAATQAFLTAAQLTSADVGPAAMSTAPAAWLAARFE